MADARPIIVTATLPPELAAVANRLRRAHFPPDRNYLDAHLTLFHAIPPSCGDELRRLLAELAANEGPVPGEVVGVMSLGRGTAIRLESPELLDLRDRIADRFAGCLTAQDDHRPRLHVTVQNKITSQEARDLQAQLGAQIMPGPIRFPALEMYFYDGGPWEVAGKWPFRGKGRNRH
ncbi:2'-5' RNA ligase family protein [Croceicoccus naphthovorans]|uniref:Uncharacterized protein n=1 Tax=Croceicoccus naphthovorans TaxID=1348774 RepID=A0A0G3XGU7_9SPHN|nr:2'-5' RNA ligase family protein [Croceicoccus naphthovorans]AKM09844.1 hypothetical protein AB433_07375 [Croceicoccus naphthovorans]MBB3991288.1 hypothetical protein [Croceicoccus naphthovorans]